MKRIVLSLLFSLFPWFFLVADSSADLDKLVNTSVSLMELSRFSPSQLDKLIREDRFIIIDGTISSITEIERSDNNLILDLHLVSGQWIGLDKVEDYKCIVNITGKKWESRFPLRVPRDPSADLILQNNRIMVIGKVSSYVMEGSELRPVVDATYIRKIQ